MNTQTLAAAVPARLPVGITCLERVVGAICSVAMALSALGVLASLGLIAWSVVMRYVFNNPPAWVDDSVAMMLVATVMLAAGPALRRGEHIGVDVLTSQLGPRGRLWSAAWAALAAIAAGCILLFNGWDTVASSRMMGIITSGEVEVPLYWLQLFLPIGGGMLILVALEALARLAAGAPSLSTHSSPLEESE